MTRIVWGNSATGTSPNRAHIRPLLTTAGVVLACFFLFTSKVSAFEVTATTITLHWTAPGDDSLSGRATAYDIRYSRSNISDANWGNATRCTGEPTPALAGSPQSYTITGLTPNTTYYIRLKTADEVPNWSQLSNEVVATTAPTTLSPRFSASPDSGAAPLQVSFADQSTGNVTGWQWQFGDGNGSTQQNPAHIYSHPGTYTVTLTISGPDGSASLVETDLISVIDTNTIASPVVNFVASVDSGAAPLQVSFSDRSTGNITSWQWLFGDGWGSTQQNPTHVYSASGTYSVRLTVSGPNGTASMTDTNLIVITDTTSGPPNAAFVASPSSGSAPLLVNFSDQSSGDITTWSWDFGDGTTSSVQSPSHSYTNPGDYDVRLIVTGPGGADTALLQAYIHVADSTTKPQVTADFTAFPLSGPSPLQVTFTDLSTGNATAYLWDFGDGKISTQPNPLHTYDQAGQYDVRLIVSNTSSYDTLLRTQYISVSDTAQPAGKIVLPSDAVSLEGEADGPIDRIRQSDNHYLTLHETISGGSSEEQFSYLHYVVGFNVPSGQTVVMHAEANRPQNDYNENFAIQWSEDNINYVTVATVTSSFDSLYSATIPVTGPRRLYIRVSDNDRTPGHNDLDALNIDYLYLEIDGASVPPDTLLVDDIALAQKGDVEEDYYAEATVIVRDHIGNPMGGVQITGHFGGPTSTYVTGTTEVNGRVTVASARTGAPEGVWSFQINNVSAPGMVFDPSLSLSLGSELAVSGVPASYILTQNYPNPFNPSTNINLWLPIQGKATVTVYDVTGRQVSVLYEGSLSAGNHVFTWDAGSFASGIYFFRAIVDGKATTKKATLLK